MSKDQTFIFNNQWSISTKHGPILASEGPKRLEYEEKLSTHHLPDMIFDQTVLKLVHCESQLELVFHVFDALKSIDMYENLDQIPKVSMSEVWRKSRTENRQLDYVKPYDWTYTTRYQGSFHSSKDHQWRFEPTEENLNLEKLKIQEAILFYDELTLYEDELADNGSSSLTVKIRCMPSGFFILLRYFLRVDGVLIRSFDTRYHYEIENSFILRDYLERESSISSLANDISTSSDINSIVSQLKVTKHRVEKIFFSKK